MYSLKAHIEKTRAKGETWTENCLIEIMTEVCPYSHDIVCSEWTLGKLDQMVSDQRHLRDSYDNEILTFTKEFSRLCTVEHVRDLVALEISNHKEGII